MEYWVRGRYSAGFAICTPKDSPAGRQRLELALEEHRRAETGDEFKAVRRGWCLGEEEFRKELLAQMNGRICAEHYGAERAETDVAKAERLIATELRRRGWTENTFRERLKGDAAKVKLTERLRAETVQTVASVAERSHLGQPCLCQSSVLADAKGVEWTLTRTDPLKVKGSVR